MEKFLVRKRRASSEGDHQPSVSGSNFEQPSKVSSKKTSYNDSLHYDSRNKHPWTLRSRVYFVLLAKCMESTSASRRGLGTRPVCNWVQATSLLQKHEKLDWHLAVVEKQALSLAVMDHGTAAEQYSGRK